MMNALSGWSFWLTIGVIWSIPWKGMAMWKAARLSHRNWFIALFLINTFGLLEIYYIYNVAKKYTVETIEK